MLCSVCAGLSVSGLIELAEAEPEYSSYLFPKRSYYQHHATFDDLIESADAGCEFCQFIIACTRVTPENQFHPDMMMLECIQQFGADAMSIRLAIGTTHVSTNNIEDVRAFDELHVQFGPPEPTGPERDYDYDYDYFYLFRMPITITVPQGQPVSVGRYQLGRYELDRDLGSDTNFAIAQRWLNECWHTHKSCVPRRPSQLPTRLVDIGTVDGPEDCRLVLTHGAQGEYVALSHCWGGPVSVKLTKGNLEDFLECLPYAALPANFRDAITIARRLGFRYLWIDSLCIIQDCTSDWEHESGKMAMVYLGSAVTICASASEGSQHGILTRPRLNVSGNAKMESADVSFSLGNLVGSSNTDLERVTLRPSRDFEGAEDWENLQRLSMVGSLASRAWTLQEGILSSRKLLYGNHQIHWQCLEGCVSANGLPGPHLVSGDSFTATPRFLCHPSFQNHRTLLTSDLEDLRSEYYRLVTAFSNRNITFDADKLPAFSGIAERMHTVFGGAYLAGIWSSDLHWGVLWSNEDFDGYHVQHYRAPSWSWAVTNGAATFCLEHSNPPLWRVVAAEQLELLHYHLDYQDISNPYGQVKAGYMALRGRTKRFLIRKDGMLQKNHEELEGRTSFDGYHVHGTLDVSLCREVFDDEDTILCFADREGALPDSQYKPLSDGQEFTLMFVLAEQNDFPDAVEQHVTERVAGLQDQDSAASNDDFAGRLGEHMSSCEGETRHSAKQLIRSSRKAPAIDDNATSVGDVSTRATLIRPLSRIISIFKWMINWACKKITTLMKWATLSSLDRRPGAEEEAVAEDLMGAEERSTMTGESVTTPGEGVAILAEECKNPLFDYRYHYYCLILEKKFGEAGNVYSRAGVQVIHQQSLDYLRTWRQEDITLV